MKQLRSFARYYRPAIVPATPEADADLFLLESGHRMTDDNISEWVLWTVAIVDICVVSLCK